MCVSVVNNAKAEAHWQELRSPKLEKSEICIQVEAAGLNRTDLLRIKVLGAGKVENPILGLEYSEIIDRVGESIDETRLGRKVCALFRVGGISGYVVWPPLVIMPYRSVIELSPAGDLYEIWHIEIFNLWNKALLISKEKIPIHAGASEVGIEAIQPERLLEPISRDACGTEDKLGYCLEWSAEASVLRIQNWAGHVQELQLQFEVVLDPVGAGYLYKDLSLSANSARVAVIVLLGGTKTDCNPLKFLSKNVTLLGRRLRIQSNSVKRRLPTELETFSWPAVARGKVYHGVEQIVMPDEVVGAYQAIQHGEQTGKTIMVMK